MPPALCSRCCIKSKCVDAIGRCLRCPFGGAFLFWDRWSGKFSRTQGRRFDRLCCHFVCFWLSHIPKPVSASVDGFPALCFCLASMLRGGSSSDSTTFCSHLTYYYQHTTQSSTASVHTVLASCTLVLQFQIVDSMYRGFKPVSGAVQFSSVERIYGQVRRTLSTTGI